MYISIKICVFSVLFIFLTAINSLTVSATSANRVLMHAKTTQPNIFLCGPTVIYLIMGYWGMENIDFKTLAASMFSGSIQGTANSSMVFYPGRFGLKTYSFTGNWELLKKLLSMKIPVIVLQNSSRHLKIGHFRVVVGVETNKQKRLVYLKDPAKKKIRKMKWNQFRSLWKRGQSVNNHMWAMVAVPGFYEFGIDEIIQSPITQLNLGTYFYRNFDYSTACEYFRKAYEKDRKNRDVLQYYAQGLIRTKEYQLAMEIIDRLMEIDPGNPVGYDLKALTHFYIGQYGQALMEIKKAVQLNRNQEENSFINEHYRLIKRFVSEKENN